MKISIITVCLNSSKTIQETIYSVASQTYNNIEHIIIDGKSDDNTLNIIKNCEHFYNTKSSERYKINKNINSNNILTNNIKSLKVISEKDTGIYDAMNKGVLASTGDYILFLNANDKLLHNQIIEQMIERGLNTNKDMVYGTFFWVNHQKKTYGFKKQTYLNRFDLWQTCPIHSTLFYKKELFKKYGKFDTSYKICADFEWNCKAFSHINKPSLLFVDLPITLFSMDGISAELTPLHKKERKKIENHYFSKFELAIFNFINTSKRRKLARYKLFGKIFSL